MEEFDAHDKEILTVLAHDGSLLEGVLEFYPRDANAWRENGWGKRGRWRFLKDLGGAIEDGDVNGNAKEG